VLGVAAHNLVEPMLHVVPVAAVCVPFRAIASASFKAEFSLAVAFPSWLLEGRFGFCQLFVDISEQC